MEFLFVLVICPIIVVTASLISTLLLKKWFIAPIATFTVFIILTFTVFGETFFFGQSSLLPCLLLSVSSND